MSRKKSVWKMMVLPLTLLVCWSCSRSQQTHNAIQIMGSDTMVNLGQAWAESFMKKNPQIMVAVTGGGSGTGISALIGNTCSIAEVSREMKGSEIALARKNGINPFEIKVALDGLAVVVNPGNPVSALTMEQLAGIFSGRIANWLEVGGQNRPIVILSREVNSGTHVYFKEHVLRQGQAGNQTEFAASALMLPSSQAIADEVAQNPGAIGYYGMGYVSAKQKALAIAKNSESPPVLPTLENVVNNSYPISRPLLMYTNGQPRSTIKSFIDFCLSAKGQQIVAKLDFVPISKI